MNKKLIIAIATLLSTVFIAVAVILANFNDPARALYIEANKLSKNAEYSLATEKYETLITKFPNSQYAEEAKTSLLATCYYNWGSALLNEKNYSNAIEKFQASQTYPKSSMKYMLEKAMLQCYYDWGQSLQKQDNYAEALEKYQKLVEINDYFFSNSTNKSIGETIPDCYYQWAQYLQTQKNFTGAIETYQFIIDANTLRFYEYHSQAEEALPQCHYERVIQLVTESQYDEAIQEYTIIMENYSSSEWAASDKANALDNVPAEVLFSWGTKLQQEQSYNTAIMLYATLQQNYPRSQYANQAEKAKVETEIAKIVEQEHGYLPPPSATAQGELMGKTELTIVNDTPYGLTIFLSGPTTKEIIIPASPESYVRSSAPSSIFPPSSVFYHEPQPPAEANRDTTTLESGTYRMAARVDAEDVNPFYGEITLNGNEKYQDWLYILSSHSYG